MFKEHLSLFNRYQFSPHLSLFPLSWWPHPRAWSEAWSWRWKGWGAHFWTEERSEDEIQLTANSFTLKRSHLSTVSSLPVAGFRLDRAAAWRQLGLRQQAELTRGQTFLTSWAASTDKLFFDSIRYRYDMRVFLSIRYDTIRYTPLLTLRSPWWWPALCAETMKM